MIIFRICKKNRMHHVVHPVPIHYALSTSSANALKLQSVRPSMLSVTFRKKHFGSSPHFRLSSTQRLQP